MTTQEILAIALVVVISGSYLTLKIRREWRRRRGLAPPESSTSSPCGGCSSGGCGGCPVASFSANTQQTKT